MALYGGYAKPRRLVDYRAPEARKVAGAFLLWGKLMASARCVGISSRVSHEVYSVLCDRAKADAVTLSTLINQILAAQLGTALTPRATETSAPPPQMTDVLARLEDLEQSVKIIALTVMSVDGADSKIAKGILCPECGHEELFYTQSLGEPDGLPLFPDFRFACQNCGWFLEF